MNGWRPVYSRRQKVHLKVDGVDYTVCGRRLDQHIGDPVRNAYPGLVKPQFWRNGQHEIMTVEGRSGVTCRKCS